MNGIRLNGFAENRNPFIELLLITHCYPANLLAVAFAVAVQMSDAIQMSSSLFSVSLLSSFFF